MEDWLTGKEESVEKKPRGRPRKYHKFPTAKEYKNKYLKAKGEKFSETYKNGRKRERTREKISQQLKHLENNELRERAFQAFCKHISLGNPNDSFFYREGKIGITYQAIEEEMQSFPELFPGFYYEQAKAKRMQYWFDIGKDLVNGKIRGTISVWSSIMKNLFRSEGWDKDTPSETSKAQVTQIAEALQIGNDTELLITKTSSFDTEVDQEN